MTWLEEHTLNRYYEMAETDREIKFKLSKSAEMIIEHFYKIYYMPLSDSKNHWITEIYSFINKVNKRKSTNKLPSKEYIYNSMFGNIEDIFDNVHETTLDYICTEYDLPMDIEGPEDKVILFNLLKDYFQWVAEELNTNGYLKLNEVRNKISQLI